jgi:hypothetical protein
VEGDIEETRRLVTDLINQKIDIPGIQEDVELMMFDGFTRFAPVGVSLRKHQFRQRCFYDPDHSRIRFGIFHGNTKCTVVETLSHVAYIPQIKFTLPAG